ncbi:unnamed protein product [Rhizophagus irregularis]|nr:unnamed protein product [Rhizophagus irregularis]
MQKILQVLDNHEREISNEASMPTDDYKELRNSCISIFNKRYKEFDEDIYLLGFFLHPKYRGHGIRDNQFERLRKCAFRIWKNLGHKKNSGLELDAQLRAYFDNSEQYNTSYSVHDTAYHCFNEHQSDETNINDETLDIESIVDLGPWVFIDNSILPIITQRYDSDDKEEWDPKQLN